MNYVEEEGICFFAYNNEQIDYVKLTTLAARHAKKYLNRPVCLITDVGTEAWMMQSISQDVIDESFDYIVITTDEMKPNVRGHYDSPWTEFKAQFNNSNKHKIWQYSPFEKTLLLDMDYIVKNDFLTSLFEYDGVAMFDRAMNLRHGVPHLRERWLYDAGITMWWSTVIYFDRSEKSELFFDTWAHVADNYQYYQFLYNFPGHLYRTDYCVSIAAHIMNGMTKGDEISNIGIDMPMVYMDQKDDIIDINDDNSWVYLVHDRKEPWKNILVKIDNIDVHVMNKRALDRMYDTIMETFDAN
jgi:hypothetical protein